MRQLTNYPGTEDRFTADILLRKWILGKFQEIYASLGYHLVETPNLEPAEILSKDGSEEFQTGDQPTFVIQDKHKDWVCLKPDQTVSLRRVIEQHQVRLPFPRHQVGFAFRQDKPEKGRCREFTQCDADVIGAGAGVPDAETVLWLQRGFSAIGLPETVIFINARTVLGGLHKTMGPAWTIAETDAEFDADVYDPKAAVRINELTFTRAIDKCPSTGDTGPVEAYLRQGRNVREDGDRKVYAARIEQASIEVVGLLKDLLPYRELPVLEAVRKFQAAYPTLGEEMAVLETVLSYCEELGVDMDLVRFDPCLARGMDYYTGPVFEARNKLWPYGSLAGGGRYDEMIKIQDNPTPAVGASFGLERIEQALKDLGRLPEESQAGLADVLVVTRPDWMPGPLRLARILRESFDRVLVFPEPNTSLKQQTKFAALNGIPVAVFFGPDEQEQGLVTLRSVTSGEEQDVQAARQTKNVQVPVGEIVVHIKAMQS